MSPISSASYLGTDTYRATIDRIIAAYADPGHDLRTTLVEILGDTGIWPDYCRPASTSLHVAAYGLQAPRAPQALGVISLANVKAA